MRHQNTVFHSILKLVPWNVMDDLVDRFGKKRATASEMSYRGACPCAENERCCVQFPIHRCIHLPYADSLCFGVQTVEHQPHIRLTVSTPQIALPRSLSHALCDALRLNGFSAPPPAFAASILAQDETED